MSNINDQMSNFRFRWINEDELPEMPQEIYDAMYPISIVNVVRMFPCIQFPSGMRYYMIEIQEKNE